MTETAPALAQPTREDRPPRRPPRWVILLLAAALVASWSVWAIHAYRAELRTVSVEELRDDLAAGTVRTYDALTEFRPDRAWPPPEEIRFSTREIPHLDDPQASTDPAIVAVAYYVDAWRAPIRIVHVAPFAQAGPGALDVHQLVAELEAAGVPPRADFVPAVEWHPNPATEAAEIWGLVTGALALVALIAIRPTRGTRWFWFWLFAAPLGLGVLAYVAAECLRPKRLVPLADGRPTGGRLRGVVGIAIAIGAKLLIPY